MKISVSNARAFALVLSSAADEAQAKGETDFELAETVKELDDAARAELEQAIKTSQHT